MKYRVEARTKEGYLAIELPAMTMEEIETNNAYLYAKEKGFIIKLIPTSIK